MLVCLPHTDGLLAAGYVRSYSGNAGRVRLGWFSFLRRRFLWCPVLVAGDFNPPHSVWGYPSFSARVGVWRPTLLLMRSF